MATSTKATLGGKPIVGASEVNWTQNAGVIPFASEFAMIPRDADGLLQGPPSAVDLTIESEGRTVRARGLYALEQRPGPNPHIDHVKVFDRRWFWPSVHIGPRRYNMRRTVGVKRVGDDGVPVNQPVVDDVAYHPASLRNGVPWTADQILRDIINEVLKLERDTTGQSAGLVIADSFRTLPVENLVIDDNGAAAIARVLKMLPEMAVTVDLDGTVRVYSRASGREGSIVRADRSGDPIVGKGIVEFLTNDRIRPREVHVLFTPEYDVRFDFEDAGGRTTARGQEDRFMENVLPLPDFSLNIGGRTLTRGTWVPIDNSLFAAWGAVPGFGVLTKDVLRRALVPYLDLATGLNLGGLAAAESDWPSRIAALQQHFRKTFRINRRWLDRILSLHAFRVATVDPTTGTRAPASVYADFSYMRSQRSFVLQAQAGQDVAAFFNVTGYPASGFLRDGKPSPATLAVIDSDQGIVRLDYSTDQNRVFEMALPSKMSNIPTEAITVGSVTGVPVGFDMLSRGSSGVPELDAQHKVAIVLTAMPAYPNDDRQLVRLIRKPSDVGHMLPGALQAGIGAAHGPVMEVRIGSGVETARVGWSDQKRNEIEKAFGVRDGSPDIDSLIINKDNNNRAASLEAIADAAAAAVYASFADRNEGGKTVALRQLAIDGFLDSISYRVEAQTGKANTTLALAQKGADIDWGALLPESTRQILFRLARPGKVA